jgi:hypothetical protein
MCLKYVTILGLMENVVGRAYEVIQIQGSGDFGAQPAKIRPFTTSTSFLMISPVANLLPFIWTGQYPFFFFFFSNAGLFFLHCNDNRPRTWALISKPVFPM